MSSRSIAVVPSSQRMEAAVVQGGGQLVPPEQAEGLVWMDPSAPKALAALLEANAHIRWVQLPFAGIESFVEAGVVDSRRQWTCAKGIYGHACAEHALLLMLSAARRMHEHVRATRWADARVPERRLYGARVVIVGAGGIAQELVPMLAPFRCQATVVSRTGRAIAGATFATTDRLAEVLADADYVVIAAPLTHETRNLFNARLLAALKPEAWLVNVARGGLVDTGAVVDALKARSLGGVALDVTEPEPLPDGHPLWTLDNVIITPHVANTRAMGAPELAALVTRNVQHFLRGEPLEGVVDTAAKY